MIDTELDYPIIQGATRKYRIRPRNDGILLLEYGGVEIGNAKATPRPRRTLVREDGLNSYALGVNETDLSNPLIQLVEWPVWMGNYKDLPTFSPNQREWTLHIKNVSGFPVLAVTPLGLDWPRLQSSHGIGPRNGNWRLVATDGGGLDTLDDDTLPKEPLNTARTAKLLSQDGSTAHEVTLTAQGGLESNSIALTAATMYEMELVTKSKQKWLMRVQNNGLIETESFSAMEAARDEWPLVMADRYGILYCVDSRWPPPIPGVSGAIGFRRRRGR